MSETALDVAMEAIGLLEDALDTINFEYGHVGDDVERERADMLTGLRRRAHDAAQADRRGWCHIAYDADASDVRCEPTMRCDRCGATMPVWSYAWCPTCGAAVATDGERR